MTIEQLPVEDAYPNARNAIAWFEYVVSVDNTLADMRNAKHLSSPEDTLRAIRAINTEILRLLPPESDKASLLNKAVAEQSTADFRRYIMATIYGVMGWIKVADLQPDKDGSYLVYAKSNDTRLRSVVTVCEYLHEYAGNKDMRCGWMGTPNEEDFLPSHYYEITHWMALPCPPEETI